MNTTDTQYTAVLEVLPWIDEQVVASWIQLLALGKLSIFRKLRAVLYTLLQLKIAIYISHGPDKARITLTSNGATDFLTAHCAEKIIERCTIRAASFPLRLCPGYIKSTYSNLAFCFYQPGARRLVL